MRRVDISVSDRCGDIDNIFNNVKEAIEGEVSFEYFKTVFDSIHFDDCIESISIIENTYKLLLQHYKSGQRILILTTKNQQVANKICHNLFPDVNMEIIGRSERMHSKGDFNVVKQELLNRNLQIYNCVCYYGNSIIYYRENLILSLN